MKIDKIVRIFAYSIVYLCAFFFYLVCVPQVHAANFKTSYNIEYFISDTDPQNFTKTSYTIALTNLQPDLIIKKFTLLFPRSFGIGSIIAKDDRGSITPVVVEKDRTIEVSFDLNDPTPGLNEVNTLYLDFLQKNIFRSKGSIWEVLIPTLESKDNDTHTITIYLPPGKHKKLSLAKPTPDSVTFDKVVWNNNTGRSIYAVFGEEQRYNLDLTYHITNPNIYKVYTDIAFPPDTLYQKVVVGSIIPSPVSVYTDSDGNYMARYNLNAHEEKQIEFKGIAEIFATPRSEYKQYVQKQFEEEQRFLFNSQPLWKLDNETPVTSNNIEDHFDYVLQTLSYNFNRVIKGNSRMGAAQALRYADQAVCTEYSDLLIASSRQRGLYVREVQGFAFANEQELRPVSQESDILHSWVEYYDMKKNIWVPIDPTWQDTSGIDYFNSFDFNHIVFALHGKRADYPYPAGSYKSGPGGRDIVIEPTTNILVENKKISATMSSFPLPDGGDSFSVDLSIQNSGNVNLWDVPLSISAQNANISVPSINISHLLPGEVKKIAINFRPKSSFLYQDVTFDISYNNASLINKKIPVPTILTSFRGYIIPGVCIFFGLLLIGILLRPRNDN
ncbi:MAG: transglutaminase domain-containing protein [bacterium]